VNAGFFGKTGFELLGSSKTGIRFRNDVSRDLIEENRHYLNGSGVAVGDINGNGLADIYFARLDGPNKLYENIGGYRFRDITEKAGVAHQGYNSTGVVFADVSGNGHLDLLISSLTKGNALYINDGNGIFTLKEDSGLGASKGATTMALADINGDGLPDLYIANYKVQTVRDLYGPTELTPENIIQMVGGKRRIKPPFDQYYTIVETSEKPYLNEVGETDELYLNRGDGVFERAENSLLFLDEDGRTIGLSKDWGLTAKFQDVTGNGLPDLYVANDFWTPDRMWINRGDGTFKAIEQNAIRNLSFASMGVDFSDINRDGHLDFVVTEMLSREHGKRLRQFSEQLEEYQGRTLHNRNSVYVNRGDNTFAQIAWYSGLAASGWSWATYFLDVDLDGYEDLIVATGFSYDYQDMDTQLAMREYDAGIMNRSGDILQYPELKLINKFFKNNGNHDSSQEDSGLRFSDKSREWGFATADISQGMAMADLNNDGDMDLVVNRFNEEAAIYENRTNAPRIAVRLKGESPNTQGIGAKIELSGGPVAQSKEITAGGNYLSGSQPQVVFAADKANTDHVITVRWPDGRISVIDSVQTNRIYEIDQAEGTTEITKTVTEVPEPADLWFDEISERLGHIHQENEYNDFRFGPLLPRKLSRRGPGLGWIDFNQDGRPDVLITSGKDGSLSLYENTGGGTFASVQLDPLTSPAPGDQTAIAGWQEDDHVNIVVGSANYEQGDPTAVSAFIYRIAQNGQVQQDQIPGILSTTGPVTVADYTGDGMPDLLVGAGFKPGRYPENAVSRLFVNDQGRWRLDEENSALLTEAGLVTDALFADITGNGWQDLLLSLEWGTLKLFENTNGRFREITSEVVLDRYKGWWAGIAVGDFTGNGRADIVAANIGLNSPYQTEGERPLKLFYSDLNRNGRLNIVDSYFDEPTGGYVPRRKLLDFDSIPTILSNVSSHADFAGATVEEIFARDFGGVPAREISTLQTMIFIQTGDGFEAHPLPAEAQFTAAIYVGVADVDNDGNEDLFLSQNEFGFPNHIPRLDAGRGLLLKGDGSGGFRSVSGTESGIKIYGEQRGAAFGDFNRDGKIDLAVSQNNGQTKLYQNKTEQAGIRVELIGTEGNRNAIGASIRMVYPDGSKGPTRFIQAGGGYGSQNGTVQVMGYREWPSAIEVTWPDGSVIHTKVIDGQNYYNIEF